MHLISLVCVRNIFVVSTDHSYLRASFSKACFSLRLTLQLKSLEVDHGDHVEVVKCDFGIVGFD